MAYSNRSYQFRIQLISWLLSLVLGIIFLRLLWLTIDFHDDALKQPIAPPCRSAILDRNGAILASSLTTFSFYAHPHKIKDKPYALSLLKKIFSKTPAEVWQKILLNQKSFVWIARHVGPHVKEKVECLGLEGIESIKEEKRIYPYKHLFCHVLGFTDLDQNGIAGLEKSCNALLENKKEPLVTTLDLRLQYALYQALNTQMQAFEAKAANGLIVHLKTGEILAMVSLPQFSPGQKSDPNAFFNRNVSGVYEFGSIMKIHNLGLFLEHSKKSIKTVFDASAPLKVGRFLIKDFRGKNRPMTVEEGFLYSSNIVNAKMALSCGIEAQKAFFKKIGLTESMPLELPERARPIIPARWTEDRLITASYGYGFAITPLHVMNSLATLVTGFKTPLTLLCAKNDYTGKRERIIDKEICKKIIDLLGKTVIEGQAKKAKASSCAIGAKTGTANLRKGRTYIQNNNMTSCVAIFPLVQPEYGLFVSLLQPKGNAKTHFYATGGWIAAPVVSRLVDQITPFLNCAQSPEKTDGEFKKKT